MTIQEIKYICNIFIKQNKDALNMEDLKHFKTWHT